MIETMSPLQYCTPVTNNKARFYSQAKDAWRTFFLHIGTSGFRRCCASFASCWPITARLTVCFCQTKPCFHYWFDLIWILKAENQKIRPYVSNRRSFANSGTRQKVVSFNGSITRHGRTQFGLEYWCSIRYLPLNVSNFHSEVIQNCKPKQISVVVFFREKVLV